MFDLIKRIYYPFFLKKKMIFYFFTARAFEECLPLFFIFISHYVLYSLEIGNFEQAYVNVSFFLIAIVLWIIISYCLRTWFWQKTYFEGLHILYSKYLTELFGSDFSKIEKFGTRKILSLIEDAVKYGMLFCLEFSAKLLSFFIALILFVYFAYKSIGIWSILILPILSIIIFIVNYFNTKAKSLRKVRRKYELIEFGQFAKIVTARNEILFAGKLDDELQKLHIPLMDQKFRGIKVVTMGWAMTTIPFAVFYFSQAGILGFAIDGVRIGTFSLATLSTLILLYGYFNTTLNTLIGAYRQGTDHLVKVFSLWEVMKKMKKTSYFQQDFTYKHGHVEIKNLNYRYENNLVLKDISLEIEGGKMYAFVGPSGGGKSTLLKIIAGYQLPDEASVFIDDQDIRFLAPISYFSNVGYLSQDPGVFEGTILENLQYAVSYELSDEEIQIALQKAGSEFVYELPDGINTYVGERGVLLSGGQKQRLAIAKLFLKNPKILLMDEPTSALDSVSEETIGNSFKELFKDKTVIIVAHRLQTVRQADCIFVIEGGQIVESGTHEELVLKEGVYKKMIELQTRF